MDGYQVAREIRARDQSKQRAIIALTGFGHEEAKRRISISGFDLHLVKPVDLGELESEIDRLSQRMP